ncbi:MAG: SHOCT domain-containing protein [Proteobacteria bacterium]|nr:SHOCT domain-containing protein [Pseudomonadota bacterium]
MDDLSKLRIPLATFKRVFDVDPAREVVSLEELIAALVRFELKPEVQRRVDRELERAQLAYDRLVAGQAHSGRYAKKLGIARDRALGVGEDPREAMATAYADLQKDIRKSVKRDLRLWSPALFREGGRRQQEDVTHVSCLVMDHDDGTPLDVVRLVWEPWFHVVHTTWSHTAGHPRFRIIVPLSEAIEVDQWARVYDWAIARSEGVVDPTGKGRASTFAMPVLPSTSHPHEAYSHAGALLDPVAEGILEHNTPPSEALLAAVPRPTPSFTGDPSNTYIGGGSAMPVDESLEDQALWDAVAPPVASASPAEPQSASSGPLASRLESWLARVAPTALAVDALERLEGLHQRGALTDDEFTDAKAAVLADLEVHMPPWAG